MKPHILVALLSGILVLGVSIAFAMEQKLPDQAISKDANVKGGTTTTERIVKGHSKTDGTGISDENADGGTTDIVIKEEGTKMAPTKNKAGKSPIGGTVDEPGPMMPPTQKPMPTTK